MGRRAVLSEERGAIAVEFALTLPVILLVLLAVMEIVVIARTQLELVAAAREGARVAATVADPARAVAAVENALSEPLPGRVRVSVSRPSVVGRPATVAVTLRHSLVTPLLRWVEVELVGRAVMRVEQ
ncbi:MAG TPA: TadE family protein [Acidimicrobiia bacterium]|nr:TadE family protein [Acidimicrobiia bacterium]